MVATLFRNSHGQLIKNSDGSLMRNVGPCCCLEEEFLGSCTAVTQYLEQIQTRRAGLTVNPLYASLQNPALYCINECDNMGFETPMVLLTDPGDGGSTAYWYAATEVGGLCNYEFSLQNELLSYGCARLGGVYGLNIRLSVYHEVVPPPLFSPVGSPCPGVAYGEFYDFFPFPNGLPVSSTFLNQAFELPYVDFDWFGTRGFCCEFSPGDTALVE